MLDKPTALSSLIWTLEFVRHRQPVSSADWWRMDPSIESSRDGYSSQDAHLFGPGGELVAPSRRMVATFG